MLFLILPDWNAIRIVQQNIRRHQNGIGKEPVGGRDSFGHFVLIAVAPFQQTHWRDGR